MSDSFFLQGMSVVLVIVAMLAVALAFRLRAARRQVESLALQVRESQRQDALGTLASGIAHDFNNILGAILGFGVLLEEDLITQPESRMMAQQITTGARRGQKIVAQLMTYSRRNRAVDHALHAPVSLAPLEEESLALLKTGIRASTRVSSASTAASDVISGDATQIGQALVNLCINADHAIGGKAGEIKISIDTVETAEARGSETLRVTGGDDADAPVTIVNGLLPAGRYVCLSVSDNGEGMTRETAWRIFDPFFTTKAVDVGTGLGLAAIEGIVHSHGGAIVVTTARFRGTTFRLYFPALSSLPSTG